MLEQLRDELLSMSLLLNGMGVVLSDNCFEDTGQTLKSMSDRLQKICLNEWHHYTDGADIFDFPKEFKGEPEPPLNGERKHDC